MAVEIKKITDTETAEMKTGAYFLVTQKEMVSGIEKEAVRRVPADNAMESKIAECTDLVDADDGGKKYGIKWTVKNGFPVLSLTERSGTNEH